VVTIIDARDLVGATSIGFGELIDLDAAFAVTSSFRIDDEFAGESLSLFGVHDTARVSSRHKKARLIVGVSRALERWSMG
jgi:hypothetical protein